MRSIRGTESRAVEFDLEPSRNGRTLDGYVAVFRSRTRIPDKAGDFDEELMPGFADRSLREHGMPVMQFDHGRDPRVGTVPVGRWTEWRADGKGYRVSGSLFDNPVVEPVRMALAEGAINGLSFRFKVSKNGDKWERRNAGPDLRHVLDADVHEAGPVVFPAYADAKVSIRSLGLAVEPVERHFEPEDEPLSIDRALRMLEQVSGMPSTTRVLDRIAAEDERRMLRNRARREHLLTLARGEKAAKREAHVAYLEFSMGGSRRSAAMDRFVAANRRADELRAQLYDECLYDEELVAGLRRRVAS